jgi:hypothetical protein
MQPNTGLNTWATFAPVLKVSTKRPLIAGAEGETAPLLQNLAIVLNPFEKETNHET